MSRTAKRTSDLKRDVERHYNIVYSQLATNIFKWEGLPETIPADWIEKQMYYSGSTMIAFAPEVGMYATKYTNSGEIDMYDRPQYFNVVNNHTGLNGLRYHREDVVIIKNNIHTTPTQTMLRKNIGELVELHITKLMNQTWQRMPVMFQGNPTVIQSLKALVEGTLEGGSPIAIVDRNLSVEAVVPVDTRTQYLGKELRDETKMVVGELLTLLGINNLEVSKNERLVAKEAEVNEEEVSANLLAFLEPRRAAAQEINEKFGLNVSVSVNEDLFVAESDQEFEEVEENYENNSA